MFTRRVTLAVSKTRCTSVIEQLKDESPSRVARVDFGDASAVEVGIAAEILYIPALHLQIWRDAIVPYEANTDDDAFRELHAASHQGRSIAHALFTNVAQCDGDVCILSNISSHDIYHYFEELYKVIILERAGFVGRYVFSAFPSRISQDLPGFSIELLDLLGIARDRVVHVDRPTVFRTAWFTTRIAHADTLAYSNVFFALRNRLAAAASGPAPGPRLWLAGRETRTLVNAEEVHGCLRRHGFTIVDLADASAGQRISAAMNADVIGAPHGSALVHSMFMKEGSTVIECFSPQHIKFHIGAVLRNLKHRYLQMVQTNTARDPYRYGHDVEVNCEHLGNVLEMLDAAKR